LQRAVRWPDCKNARDLGGLPLAGGGETRRGVLYRADSLSRLTPAGLQALRSAGVGTVIDLREAAILSIYPHPLTDDEAIRYRHLPLLPEDFPLPVPLDAYDAALDAALLPTRAVVAAILGEPSATVFHCHSGTGRTGVVSLVLLSLAGAERGALAEDYLASYDAEPAPPEAGAVVERVLARLARYGGAAAYLARAGVAEADVAALYQRLRGL
jgi:protein-tyrosine phosphatase